jgi:hypothetical protein
MADPKKLTNSSSLLSTTNTLLSSTNTSISSSSLLTASSLLCSSKLNTISPLLSNRNAPKPTTSVNANTIPPSTSFKSSLINTYQASTSSLSTLKLTSNISSLSRINYATSTLEKTEPPASLKRKANALESTVFKQLSTQDVLSQPATTTMDSSPFIDQPNYNIENIQPIQSTSVGLNIDLHCHVPAPKRPRIDPFHSIFTRLDNISTTDDDFNVGIKSIKVRQNDSHARIVRT